MTTLRYDDEIGLFKPIHVDSETGYRFYTMDQLPYLHRILAFKELGLELTQISELLDEGISSEVLQGMLRLRQAQLQQHIQTEQEQLVRIEARLRSLEQGSGLSVYEVVLKAVKAITTRQYTHARALVQLQDRQRELVERILIDLKQFVARIGLEHVHERSARMALERESRARQDRLRLSAQIRDALGGVRIHVRGE